MSVGPGTVPAMTDNEKAALALAAKHYRYPAARDTHALERLGMTPVRFAQVVDALLDRPDALAAMPSEVNRLRRLRDARRAHRRRSVA
jgi:hypothetical protein